MSQAMRPLGLGWLAALTALAAALLIALPAAFGQNAYDFEQVVAIQDSDATVSPDAQDVELDVVVRFTADQAIAARDISIDDSDTTVGRITGRGPGGSLFIDPDPASGRSGCKQDPDDNLVWNCVLESYVAEVIGFSEGDYTISVRNSSVKLTVDGEQFTETLQAAIATLTIGEVVEVASVSLDLAEGETPLRSAGGSGIDLILSIINENGAAADPSAIASIFVTAPVLRLSTESGNGGSCNVAVCQWSPTSVRRLGGTGAADILLTAASEIPVKRTISVQVVTTSGENFSATSPELTFSGSADALTLLQPEGSLLNIATSADDRDKIRLQVTAQDNTGIDAEVPTRLSVTIRNPQNGTVASNLIRRSQTGADADTEGRVFIELQTLTDSEAPLPIGAYTLRVSRSGISAAEQTFNVAGPAAEITVSGTTIRGSSGGLEVTVTAVVDDANGEPVADGTPVVFATTATTDPGGAQLLSLGGGGTVLTENGIARNQYLALSSGTAVVTAAADGKTGFALLRVSAAANPLPTPVSPGAAGLSSTDTNNYASWISDISTSAGELFGDLRSRSVDSIWKWDRARRAWVSYGEVRSRVIPGSNDFSITLGDILWLSG